MLSLLLLLLFSFVSSGPIKFSTGGQFTLQKTSKPHEFADNIYIFSYQDCLEKVNVLGNFILKNVTYSTAPYGCFLAANEHPPTVYWNPDNTNQACSDTYACVVNNADYVDTFFYGQKTVKNVSDTRAGLGKTSFTKNVIETIPMQLQTITELITQKQCSDDDHCNNGHNDCQPGDNCVAHEYKCQTDWIYNPSIMSNKKPTLSYLHAFIGPPQSGDLQHYHNGNVNDNCAGEDDCKTTCSESITCMGYSKYTYRDDTEPWPDSTNTFDMVGDVGGNCCMGDGCSTNEDDCKTKCANDDDCEGYTKYWWPVVVDGTEFTEQNTEEIPTDLCTSALRNNIATNTNYQIPNIVGFSIPTRDYSPRVTSSLTSTTNTQGCQIVERWCAGSSVSGEFAEYFVKTYGTTCHGECASINSVGGGNIWNIFHSSSGSIASSSRNFGGSQHVGYYTNGEPHTTISCTYSLQHTPLRRIVQWRWGKITTSYNHILEESYVKTNNAEQWKYGLKNNAGPNYVNVQLMQSSTKMLRNTIGNYENTNTLNKEDCESVRNTNQITLWKHYIGSYPATFQNIPIASGDGSITVSSNSMAEIDTDKLPYGCLLTTGGTVHWNEGNNPASPESVNTIFNQCGAFQVEYYGEQFEDDFNTLRTSSTGPPAIPALDSSHWTGGSSAASFIQWVNGIEYYNAICIQYPTVPCTFNTPGGGVFYQKNLSQFPTTNEDIAYVRNDNRVSLLQPIKTNTEDALRFCLDLCDRTADCFYANIGADNACEMYRKCESSSTSTRELYRKLPFFLNLSSTSSDVSSSYYYDIGVLDNSCNMIEDRLDCYLDYCNRHTDIRDDLCDDTCDTDEELALCKTHWEEKGINDPSRNFDEATECITNIEIAQTSRDNNCPEFCVNTPGCSIAYKSDTACHALPYCTMEAGNTKGHIITKIVRDQSYHPMFPYNAFWSCDGIVMENVDIDTCIEKTKSEDRFIFSYNNDTNTCLVYEHYKENAYDELMDHGINATWCYSNGILQDAITSLGSCSAPTWDERNQVETLESKHFTTLVDRKSGTGAQHKCMTPFSTLLSGHNIVLSSNLLTYLNLVDALTTCFETSDCHHIVQFEAQNQIVLASSVTPTFIEVDNGASLSFAVLDVTSGSPALEGSFDWMSEADCEEYAKRNGNMWGGAYNHGSRPLGCYKRSDSLYYYYQTTVNNNIDCDTSWICIKKRWWTTITSGSPAIEGDAAYVNQDECRYKYNNDMYAGSGNQGSGIVSGCYFDGYSVFFQTATTNEKCGDTQQCIQKSADPLRYVSQAECEAYADPLTWYPSDYGSAPSGCFLHSNGQVQFNQGGGVNQCNNAGHKCIQKAGVEVGTFTTVDKTCDLPPNACIDLETRSMTLETSGYPDTSITKVFDDNTRTSMDCQSAAEELGYTVSSIEIVTKPNSATGCILDSNTAKWNIGPYETLALTYPFEECLDNTNCEVGKPEDENEFTEVVEYIEVASGAPDGSVSEEECEQYFEQYKTANGYTHFLTQDSPSRPKGCWLYNNVQVYWNYHATGSGNCNLSQQNCIQKKAISLEKCMIKVHKLGKEAGHHALGEHLDGTGEYTGGTCWYKNSGSITSTLAAHNVKHEVGGSGFIEVNNKGFTSVDHGVPDLSLSLEECQVYAGNFPGTGGHVSTNSNGPVFPKGCYHWDNGGVTPSIYFGQGSESGNCGHTHGGDTMRCIQKIQGWITEADCGAANYLVGVSASDYTTISDFHKPHGCIEGAWNNRPSSPTPTINLEYVQFSATSALDICQGNCGGDDNKCKDNLKCESGTTVAGCTGTPIKGGVVYRFTSTNDFLFSGGGECSDYDDCRQKCEADENCEGFSNLEQGCAVETELLKTETECLQTDYCVKKIDGASKYCGAIVVTGNGLNRQVCYHYGCVNSGRHCGFKGTISDMSYTDVYYKSRGAGVWCTDEEPSVNTPGASFTPFDQTFGHDDIQFGGRYRSWMNWLYCNYADAAAESCDQTFDGTCDFRKAGWGATNGYGDNTCCDLAGQGCGSNSGGSPCIGYEGEMNEQDAYEQHIYEYLNGITQETCDGELISFSDLNLYPESLTNMNENGEYNINNQDSDVDVVLNSVKNGIRVPMSTRTWKSDLWVYGQAHTIDSTFAFTINSQSKQVLSGDVDYCYYDGSCSSTTPCLRQRCESTSSSDRRRRLLQLGGGLGGGGLGTIVSATFASDKAYDEGDPCGFVEYWHARQVASFNVMTKPQTVGGWVPGVYVKNTGVPDVSMSEEECRAYGVSQGVSFSSISGATNGPTGCGWYSSAQPIYWTTNGGNCGTNGVVCIQKHTTAITDEDYCKHLDNFVSVITDPLKATGCIIENDLFYYNTYAFNGVTTIVPGGKIIQGVDNGAPNDGSVTLEACKAYANTISGSNWGTSSRTDRPNGCYHSGSSYRFAPDGTANCGTSTDDCIQKVDILSYAISPAPCSATTPCFKHHEKHFNSTYEIDTATGETHCYEGSGALQKSNMPHKKSRVLANNQVGELTDYTGLVRSDDCPEAYEWSEIGFIEVPNGVPATLGVKVTFGSPALEGSAEYVSIEDCKEYAASVGAANTNTPQTYGNIRPSGCFDASGGYIYYNTVTSSTYTCDTTYPCIQKSPTVAAYVNIEECQAYGEKHSLYYSNCGSHYCAFGCTVISGNIYYRSADPYDIDKAYDCSVHNGVCIQKQPYQEDNYKTYMLGSIQYDVGADTCGSCFPGHYTSEDSVCLPCQIGRYVSKERISTQGYIPSCLFCEPGRFQNEEGQASCKACERRTYQDERGQTSCKPVDDGQFAVGTGTWTGTSGPDQSNTRSDEATAFEGALTQANGCDTNDGYFFVCVNEDGTEFTPILTEGQNIETACVGGNFRCSACGPGNKIVDNACVPCPQGTYQNALRARGSSCKSCVVGQYQFDIGEKSCKETDPGYFQNSIMQFLQLPCPSGSFTSVSGSENCIPCPVGRSSTEGQTLTDSGEVRDTISVLNCYGCSAGLFQDEIGKIKCKNCDQGQFSGVDATECVDCVAGKFREFSTDGDCRFTDKGYFQHQEGQDGQLPCSEGSIAPVEGETNPSCQACSAGKFQDEPGRSECKLCAAGRYNSASGFHINCKACNPGTSSEDVISRVICNPCAAGKYADGSTNNLCVPCLQGEWSGGGASVCNKCPSGYEATALDEDGHVSQDLACNRCAKGTYQSDEGNYQCKICPRGRYLPTEGGIAIEDCIGCPAGTFLSDGSATAGTDKTLHDNKEEDCKSCQDTDYTGAIPGGYSLEGAHECILCAAGSFTSKSNPSLAYEDQCTECDPGSYNPSENSQCIPCGSGQYQNQNGATSCKVCLQGTEPTADRTDCQDCTAGKYQESNSGGTCKDCPVGKYTPAQGMSVCSSCGERQCANAGATSCTNTHTNTGGAPSSSATCYCDTNSPRAGACVTCGTSQCRGSDTITDQVVSTAEVSIDCVLRYSNNYGMMVVCLAEAWTETITTVVTQKEVAWWIKCGGDCGGSCNSNAGTCN